MFDHVRIVVSPTNWRRSFAWMALYGLLAVIL